MHRYMYLKPQKSLGQHFLKDSNIARKIVNSLEAADGDRVVEIGPGTGALTVLLSQRFSDLHVFEVDPRSIEVIGRICPGVVIHPVSFLDAGLDFLSQNFSGKLVVVGNLPYFITSPILFRILDSGMLFSQAVFMIQKEVADRLTARPRTKEYGILSVQTQVLGNVEQLFSVSRHVFQPPPKVESAVITYRPGNAHFPRSSEDLPVSLDSFKMVVRTAFQQRRKKLSNALKSLLGDEFPNGFDAGRRAEELEPPEFVELAAWHEHLQK